MSKKLHLVLFLACISLLNAATHCETIDCPFVPSNPHTHSCFNRLPFCRRYSKVVDPDHPGKYIFSCDICDSGFKAKKPVARISVSSYDGLPIDDSTLLCDIDETYTGEVEIIPLFLVKMFPHCYALRWSGVSRDSRDTYATFECSQCMEAFSPLSSDEVEQRTGSFNNFNNVYSLCKRNEGTFDCDQSCQSREFPDCKMYTISKVHGLKEVGLTGVKYYEVADFYCKIALNGRASIQLPTRASTDPETPKILTELTDIGSVVECTPQKCFIEFPNCLKYTIFPTQYGFAYKCLQCRSGFVPGKDVIDSGFIWSVKRLCKPVDVVKENTDAYWQFEVPNCLEISRTQNKLESDSTWTAVYQCSKCSDGYEPNSIYDGVRLKVSATNYKDFSKALCIQKENRTPTVCDDNCKQRYPRCNLIKFERGLRSVIQGDIAVCLECEQGYSFYTPLSDPHENEAYFLYQTKTMCMKSITDGPVSCDKDCKRTFPHCDTISVSVLSVDQSRLYKCHQCEEGFYPIKLYSLDPEQSGTIKQEDVDKQERSDIINLCTDGTRPHSTGLSLAANSLRPLRMG